MPEVEVKEVAIDTLSPAEYNKARDEGKTVVEMPVSKPAEEVEAKPAEEANAEQVAEEEKPLPKKIQRRIDHFKKLAALSEERAVAAETRAKEFEAKSPKTEPVKKAEGDPEPKQDDFQTVEEYFKAQARWEVRQELREQAEAAEREAEEEAVKGIFDAYKERVLAAKEKYSDYDEVVSESVKSPWPEKNPTKMDLAAADAFRTAVFEDQNAAEIAYYYGKHPDEFLELGGKTPAQVVKSVARLSDKLGIAKPASDDEETEEEITERKIVSKSAPPIKPINTGASRSTVPLDKMSQKDYEKARAAGRQR